MLQRHGKAADMQGSQRVQSVDFAALPAELFVAILSYLDLRSLVRCESVSQEWRRLARDDGAWRHVAIRHKWAEPTHTTIDDVTADISDEQVINLRGSRITLDTPSSEQSRAGQESTLSSPLNCYHTSKLVYTGGANSYFIDLSSFRDLCRRSWSLAQIWQGREDPAEDHGTESGLVSHTGQRKPVLRKIETRPPDRDAWRIKTCPQDKLLICTGHAGGITVVDLESGKLLWTLNEVGQYTHVEYDRGYFVIDDSTNGSFRIYRAASRQSDVPSGEFTFCQRVNIGRPTRALRFQYPFLCVATRDNHIVFVDIRSFTVVQTISLDGAPYVFGGNAGQDRAPRVLQQINYIDFDDDFIFIVGGGSMSFYVVSRRLSKVIWSIWDYVQGREAVASTYLVAQNKEASRTQLYHFAEAQLKPEPRSSSLFTMYLPTRDLFYAWQAVHPDFRTNTLVVVGRGNILLLRDYVQCFKAWERRLELLLNGSIAQGDFSDSTLDLNSVIDFVHDGRPRDHCQLAVADSRALCSGNLCMLFDLDPSRLSRNDPSAAPPLMVPAQSGTLGERWPGPKPEMQPNVSVHLLFEGLETEPTTHARLTLEDCPCVQMDGSAIYAVQFRESRGYEIISANDVRWVGARMIMDNIVQDNEGTMYRMRLRLHDFNVFVWDFAEKARTLWSDQDSRLAQSTMWTPEEDTLDSPDHFDVDIDEDYLDEEEEDDDDDQYL